MVKINKTLGLALLTALAASCSSDNDVAQSNNPVIENGKGAYTKISINLPTTDQASPFSRATDGEPSYADGDATEYSVNDGVVLVFQNVDGNQQNFVFTGSSDLDLKNSSWSTAGGGKNVTTEASFVVNLPSYDAKTGNAILVLLNNKDKDGNNKVALPAVGTKYGDWNKAQATETVGTAMQDHNKGFFMASAARFAVGGDEKNPIPGTATVTTLTGIIPNAVTYDKTKAQAQDFPSTDVYVERGLAKVTMTKPDDKDVQAGRAYAGDKVSFSNWKLDVTNKTSYPVHNTVGMWADFWKDDRFYSSIDDGFQRVYWGVDPNYSGSTLNQSTSLAACQTAFNMMADADINGEFGTAQYCLENTFDIDNMTQGQTTRVVIKATYTPKDGTTGTTFYKLDTESKLYTQAELEAHIKQIAEGLGYDMTNYTINLAAANNNITAQAGTHQLTADNVVSNPSPAKSRAATTPASKSTWDPSLGPGNINAKIGSISTYYKGVCYYIGRIKHFNELTPWNPGDPTYVGSDNSIDYNAKYLGRYGVLRNNWYDLTLGTVTGPGDPTVPPVVPEKPDDEKNNYINLSVKILSWAKRSQTIDL